VTKVREDKRRLCTGNCMMKLLGMNPFLLTFFPPAIGSASSHTDINTQAKGKNYGPSSLPRPLLRLGVLHMLRLRWYSHRELISLFQVTSETGHGPLRSGSSHCKQSFLVWNIW